MHAVIEAPFRRMAGRSSPQLVLRHRLFFGLCHTSPQRKQGTEAPPAALAEIAVRPVQGSARLDQGDVALPCLRCGLVSEGNPNF